MVSKTQGKSSPGKSDQRTGAAEPRYDIERADETQLWGEIIHLPIDLPQNVRAKSVAALNQLLADTMTLRDMYKKHHWQISGATFYQLHLLYDAHYEEQAKLVDTVAERIMSLGGLSVAMAHDVAEMTMIRRPPRGREAPAMQLTRLIEAHHHILAFSRGAAKEATEAGDEGTADLFVTDVIRLNEKQTWFLAEHLVPIQHLGG